jgi:hypothetical protein
MKKITKKDQWVNAIKETIQKYQDCTYECDINKCSLCLLSFIYFNKQSFSPSEWLCNQCILGTSIHYITGCRQHKTFPIPHRHSTYPLRIKFWEQVLLLIEPMSPHQFAGKFKHFPKILRELDQQVYEKYFINTCT